MKTLVLAGVELAVADQGVGIPLVLVHGFPLDHTMWQGQLGLLPQHCRMIAPDLRGFGQSPGRDDLTTIEQFADDLAALTDALGLQEPIVLAGLSMGGYIALEFWRKYRGRLRGLVLSDTRAAADSPEAAAARLQMADRVLREGPAPLAEAMLPRLLAPGTQQNHPHLRQFLERMILTQDPQGIAAAARGMAQRRDFTTILPQINCPTLVVVGRQDVISPPAEMATITGALPDARLVEISDAGHLAPLENPAEFNRAVLEFLATL